MDHSLRTLLGHEITPETGDVELEASETSTERGASGWYGPVLAGLTIAVLGGVLWWAWDGEAVRAWKEEASPIQFFLVMAVLPMLGVPVTPFFLVAGATFGITRGLVGSAIALAIHLALAYWLASGGMRPKLRRALEGTRFQLPDYEGRRANAFRFAVVTKLAPGMSLFKHLIIALAGVPFRIYFAVCFAFTGLYGAALVVLGESLLEHDFTKLAAALGLLAAVTLGLAYWRRRRRRASDPDR